MKLYELSNTYAEALDVMTDPDNDIDMQTINDTLEGLDAEIDDKILNVARFVATIEAEADAIKVIEDRQKARRQRLERISDDLRDYLKFNLQKTAKDKVKAADIEVKLAKTPAAVRILDESVIPFEFFDTKQIMTLSKTRIKAAGGCEGAVIETGFRVSIK